MRFSLRRSRLIIKRARKLRAVADPSLVVFSSPWTTQRGRIGPFFLSLCLHVLIVMAVLTENYLRPPLELHIETPEQLLADNRYKLTWPVFPNDLPPVQPIEKPKPAVRPKAGDKTRPRFKLPQQVVADDPAAASRRQMIWDQAPAVELARDVRSPNFVEPQLPAMQRPRFEPVEGEVQAPPGRRALVPEQAPRVAAAPDSTPDALKQTPRLRYWNPKAQQATPSKQAALAAESAPRVQAAPGGPQLAAVQPAPELRYWTPETAPQAPERRVLTPEAAPAVSAGPGPGLNIGQLQKLSRLRYWTPQQGAGQPGKSALEPGQAPQIQAAPAGSVDLEEFQRLSRLRYQQAQDSAGGQAAAPSREALAAVSEGSPDLGAAGAGSAAPGGATELIEAQALASLGDIPSPGAIAPGRAVVGADPDSAAPEPPRGSRSGSFTAGPDGGAPTEGTGTDQGQGNDGTVAGIRIPNLSVTPASPEAPAGLSDGRPPEPGRSADPQNTDRQTLLDRFRAASYAPTPAIGVLDPERAPDPDFPFPGRAVYTLAVNMPNVNSYSGSWIIEFVEANKADTPGELTPPSPRLKVDPVYSRAAIDERIEGDVVLHAMIRSDGLVDHIEILKRLDSRLDESAKAALSKWRFHPATKRGVPVDIETVVRIPFRLAPIDDRKR
jgi:TonB family protein